MGYESRIYVVNRHNGYDEPLAAFNLSSIDSSLLNVLQKKNYTDPSPYEGKPNSDFYAFNHIIDKDVYGKVPTECTLKEFYSELTKVMVSSDGFCYRRYEMVLGFILPLLHSKQWDELIIVHIGY